MKVNQLRANLKGCLDRAANGEVIEVERMGQKFILMLDHRDKPLGTSRVTLQDQVATVKEMVDRSDDQVTEDDLHGAVAALSDAPEEPPMPAAFADAVVQGAVRRSLRLCEHGREKGECVSYGCPYNPNKP